MIKNAYHCHFRAYSNYNFAYPKVIIVKMSLSSSHNFDTIFVIIYLKSLYFSHTVRLVPYQNKEKSRYFIVSTIINDNGAVSETRTHTNIHSLPPQSSASTYSAITAYIDKYYLSIKFISLTSSSIKKLISSCVAVSDIFSIGSLK